MSDDEWLEEEQEEEENEDNTSNDEILLDTNVKQEKKEYVVLSAEDLLVKQNEVVKKVSEILDISPAFARILAIFFRWDEQKLLDIFFEKGKEVIYRQAGVSIESSSKNEVLGKKFECSSCLEMRDSQDTTALACGHRFCNVCWSTYISMQVREGQAKNIRCMGSTNKKKCNIMFDESKIGPFLDDELSKKYAKQQTESFVEDNPRVKWCPSIPHCGYCIQVSVGTVVELQCKCGTVFCFSCSHLAHSPASCEMTRMWEIKCKDDSETANYIQANTKTCPTCGNVVEKNGGCNLMTCRCGSYFCWLCGEKTGFAHTWEKIENHTCGRFKGTVDVETENPQESLQRYIFYWERYKAHLTSQTLEAKLFEEIKKAVQIYCVDSTPLYELEMSWIQHSLSILSECRRALSWSYVFCYYVFGDPKFCKYIEVKERKIKKNLFEDYQEQLEQTLERLSLLFQKPDQVLSSRDKIKEFSQFVEKRCRGLFDIINEEILPLLPNVQISPWWK